MKKFVVFSALVAIAVIALFCLNEVVNEFMCRETSMGDERLRKAKDIRHLFTDLGTDEIPIIGSSRAGCYIPSIISSRCKQYSFSGSRLKETLFLLSKVVSSRKSGIVIVNVDPWGAMGYDEPFKAVYDLVADDKDVKAFVPELARGGRFFNVHFRYAFRFKRNLQNYVVMRKQKYHKGKPIVRQSRAVSDEEWKKMNQTVRPWFFEDRVDANEYVAEILSRQQSNKVVWVVAPVSPYKRLNMQNPEAVENFLANMATHEGNYVFDFFTDGNNSESGDGFAQEDFVDPNHLNIQGSKKFSLLLRKALDSSGLLPNE